MEILAHRLARIVLSEAEDPKEFLKKISREQTLKNRRIGKVSVAPAEEWDEWEDLEEWQRIAAKQMEEAENAMFQLHHVDTHVMELEDAHGDWWTVFMDEEIAESRAKQRVSEDLHESPENFNQDWLQGFINKENLQRQLYQDMRDDDYWNEQYPSYEEKIEELVKRDLLDEDPRVEDEEGDLVVTPEVETLVDEKWEEMIEEWGKRDAMDFLNDIYGEEDAVKQAMQIGGIDYDAAIDSAIATDGWQHFLAHHDGNSYDLPGGAVYIRQ
jgi:hypothetical protein